MGTETPLDCRLACQKVNRWKFLSNNADIREHLMNVIVRRQRGYLRQFDSMSYPLTMCALQIVFMIMIIRRHLKIFV